MRSCDSLAAQKLSHEPPGQTLQATALVHEAYLRLVGLENQTWRSKAGHFFVAAAEAMRRILIDHARHKKSLKHGGDHERVPLDEAVGANHHSPVQEANGYPMTWSIWMKPWRSCPKETR